MTQQPVARILPRFMSLRWQALIALSLVLFLINGTLAFMAYQQSYAQYDLIIYQAQFCQAPTGL